MKEQEEMVEMVAPAEVAATGTPSKSGAAAGHSSLVGVRMALERE